MEKIIHFVIFIMSLVIGIGIILLSIIYEEYKISIFAKKYIETYMPNQNITYLHLVHINNSIPRY